MEMNRVTIKDANMFPSADEFIKKFSKYIIISLINFFSEYDQIELDLLSRDMTVFMISLRLLKMTTLS
jgi:hypothetical protein